MNLKRSTQNHLSPFNASAGRLLPDGSLEEPTEMRLVIRPDGRLEVESEIGREIKKKRGERRWKVQEKKYRKWIRNCETGWEENGWKGARGRLVDGDGDG